MVEFKRIFINQRRQLIWIFLGYIPTLFFILFAMTIALISLYEDPQGAGAGMTALAIGVQLLVGLMLGVPFFS